MTGAAPAASIAARDVPRDLRVPVSDSNLLSSVLACPRCGRGPVAPDRSGWLCAACSSGFPVIGGIPWLFPDPRQSLAEWRGRLGLLNQFLGAEAGKLRAEAQAELIPDATRRRLLHAAAARDDQILRLRALLAPLGLEHSQISEATHHGLGTRLPTEQGLTNYYVNLHRDWAWGADENAASLAEIVAALGDTQGLGRTLVHGAGAGRLAYDLHQVGDAPLTVATDFNPLLLAVAREMFAGRALELYEFPIAPRRMEDQAVLRRLSSPGAARPGLELVAADALHAPFADGAFDTVVTPWFIDIIGEPFAHTAARVNLALRPGGRWINFGSLAFAGADHAGRIGLEEALEAMSQSGFADVVVRETTLPYMRSPASRHSRMENVVTWVTQKSAPAAQAPRGRMLPEWLTHADRPVPRTPAFEMRAISSRVHAFLLAMINGERSMRDMARMLVDQRLMTADEAEAQVRIFLTRLHEDSQSG